MESGTALREYLEFVISHLIDHPDEASLSHEVEDNRHLFYLKLHPDDVGKVIGKNGYTISSIRSLLNAGAARSRLKASLKIVEDEEGGGRDRGRGRGGDRHGDHGRDGSAD